MSPTHEARMTYIDGRLKELGVHRCREAYEVAAERDMVSGALLLALGIRESGLRNVAGDKGHARGCHQIHDAFHADALRKVDGCRMSSTIAGHTDKCWVPVPDTTALEPGMCPTFADGCRIALGIVNGLIAQAQHSAKVPDGLALHTALAAYNCGFGAAEKAAHAGDPDSATTGKDYGRDVLLRRSEVAEWMTLHPHWKQ